ncbi:MAG: uridine kinase [Candidatus Latescibacteria bacterium]|nr:uridine kinase [Candidatus Latescibacterota bacterium]
MEIPYIIGIAGGTGAGKTTLAQTFLSALSPPQACLIPHDAYYRNLSHLPLETRAQTNFDHPNALETELLITHLKALTNNQTVQIPTYDFTSHTRTIETIPLTPRPIIIVEGILLFENTSLCDLFNLKIFVDADADIRFARRLTRDVTERGRTPESVTQQYLSTVRPMHNTYVAPSRKQADLIIPCEYNTTLATKLILTHLKSILSST